MKTTMEEKIRLIAVVLLVGLIYAGIAGAATAPTPVYLGVVGQGLGKPGQAAVDYKNNLFVTYPENKLVRVFSAGGQLIKTLEIANDGNNLFNLPTSVAADLSGKVFVGDKDRVVVLDLIDSNYLSYLGAGTGEFSFVQALALYYPYCPAGNDCSAEPAYMQPDVGKTPLILAADSYGSISYIKAYRIIGSDYVKVPIYDSDADGILDADLPLPANILCTGIAVDNIKKKLVVTDRLNYKVYEYNLGNFTSTPAITYKFYSGGGMGMPVTGQTVDLTGAAVDTAGRLYVACGFNSYVQVADRDNGGAKLGTIGSMGSGVAQMWQPTGVLIDFKKRLIISDYRNGRLLLFLLDAGPPVPYSAPDCPVLLDPLNKIVGNQPSLTISNLYEYNGSAVDYTIEVSASQDFAALVRPAFTDTVAAGTFNATVPGSDWGDPSPLLSQTKYWWRAKARNNSIPELESDWSEVGSFYINTAGTNQPPAAPQLKAPTSNSSVGMETLLEWYAAVDPDAFDTATYTVEVFDNTPKHVLVATKTGITDCRLKISDLIGYNRIRERKLYSWRVKATDSFGATSAPSNQRTFLLIRSGVRIKALPGTWVYIEGNDAYLGQFQGVVPTDGYFTVELEPGRHVVRLQKTGYNPLYASIKVYSKMLAGLIADQKAVAEPLTASTLSIPQAVTFWGPINKKGHNQPTDYHPQGARPLVVDWYDDGVKELLVGESNGNITLLSPAEASSPAFQSPVLLANIGSAAAPFVVDWENNGIKDILVGDGSGFVRLYSSKEELTLNNYNYLLDADGSYITVPTGPAVPWVVDWNNDGKKDLLVGAGDGYVYLFINDAVTGTDSDPKLVAQGRLRFTDRETGALTDLIAAPGLDNAAPLMAYWDIDGNLDLLVGYGNGQIYLFKNEPQANPVFYGDAVTPLFAPGGTFIGNYLEAGASPFVVTWKWGTNTVMDLLLGSEQKGLWATRLNNLQ